MRTSIQRFARTLLTPFTIVIFAGLMLGIATVLQNPILVGSTIANSDIMGNIIGAVQAIAGLLFKLLPILFAIGVATGMANEDKEVSGFAAVIAFLLFHTMISYLLQLNGVTSDTTSVEYLIENGNSEIIAYQINSAYETTLGIFTYRMNIFGGIIVGLWTSIIHNRFHKQELPTVLSFFSGTKFVPVMILITIPALSIASYFVWPFVNDLINGIGMLVNQTGAFGTFIFGFVGRILTPTGLHHILNQMVRFTPIGGSAEVDGELVTGALNIFNAEMASDNQNLEVMRNATQYLSQGFHPVMLFGLPAACLAMYHTAYSEQRQKVKGMLITVAATSFLAGITEPIEFAFIFISPFLFIFHSIMSGLAFMIMSLLNVIMGNAMGGFGDFLIFGILQGTYTRWPIAIVVGIGFALIYYYVFKYIIIKHDLKTPGRTLEHNAVKTENANKESIGDLRTNEKEPVVDDNNVVGKNILKALGGRENIVQIDNCISRLRLVLNDSSLIDEPALESTGSMGIIKVDDKNVQVVYGTKVEQMARLLKTEIAASQ